MTLEGIVQNGIVVLENGASIPNGTHVKVVVPEAKEQPTFLDLLEFAGCMPDMPADFAAQHDHYIHGTPRK
jgi:hypothetical protein